VTLAVGRAEMAFGHQADFPKYVRKVTYELFSKISPCEKK
jgi:hypothetical protein